MQIDMSSGNTLPVVGGTRDVFVRREEGAEFPAEITTNSVAADGKAFMLTVVIDRTERHELQRNRRELAQI